MSVASSVTIRFASALATWLKQHPGILAISRDRAGEYAPGAKQGAPESLQIADRFHLTKNLSEVAERILAHHRQALRSIQFVPASATSSSPLAVRYLRPARKRKRELCCKPANWMRLWCPPRIESVGRRYATLYSPPFEKLSRI